MIVFGLGIYRKWDVLVGLGVIVLGNGELGKVFEVGALRLVEGWNV